MNKKPYFISTPIYYPSDRLHIGHAYCTTIADAIARFQRLTGKDVFFLTGSDEHGQKIQRKAAEVGQSPIQYVDHIVASFQMLWEKLGISNDDFIRTTEKRHHEVVQAIFQKIYDQGDIYKAAYEGWYCTPCETFWLERQLTDGKCPDCGRPVEMVQEESYFFRMSKYQDRLLKHIEDHPEFIQPVSRRNEMINFIKQGLEDLCVSRTTFDWGIPVPFDRKHVVYVWFDALTNYITAAGYLHDPEKFAKFWPADVHLVGKEIVRFHSIIWPIILMALGVELPKKVYGHGWLVVEGDKMSKSKGNVIDPVLLIEEFGADAIRYFLLREINLGQDGNFSRDALIKRINSDLANDLGNLLHRTLNMMQRYNGGVMGQADVPTDADAPLLTLAKAMPSRYRTMMENMDINGALKEIWQLIGRANKYIDETEPWKLAKDPAQAARLNRVLLNLLEVLSMVSVLVEPFIPTTSSRIRGQLGLPLAVTADDLTALDTFGTVDAIRPGHRTGKPEPIFPRIEEKTEDEAVMEKVITETAKPVATAPATPAPKTEPVVVAEGVSEISIDDFAKLDLRTAIVTAAEKVEKTEKLLQLTVDLGTEQRTIVSGIAQFYTPEELVGRTVILIANLKPAKIRGIESHGMLLAASNADKSALSLVTAPNLPAGCKVK
ncbi:MAG: methionine--tRNA ligase [Veillonellaceae bacterium]|nr:methionine--tRNA ligase [Veillonellaceae bacterium]